MNDDRQDCNDGRLLEKWSLLLRKKKNRLPIIFPVTRNELNVQDGGDRTPVGFIMEKKIMFKRPDIRLTDVQTAIFLRAFKLIVGAANEQ